MRGLRPTYPIRTERLDLRPHRSDDLDDLFAFHSRPEVTRYVPWPVRDREQTEAALTVKLGQDALTEAGQWLVLAVELRETGTVIGEVLLKWVDESSRQGELGFVLHSGHHGRGLAAEAAQAMLRLGFDELGLHRITAVCVAENTASARLLGRLGMRAEGRLAHSVLFKGEWTDQLLFGLLEDDWRHGSADRDAIDDLARTFFAAFASGPDCDAGLDALPDVLLPAAVIVRTCGTEPVAYDVADFIAPRRALLSGGTLVDFREWETSARTEIHGDIAQRLSTYSKAGTQDGEPFTGRGVKTMQFVRTAAGWRISSAAWDDERPGFDLGRPPG